MNAIEVISSLDSTSPDSYELSSDNPYASEHRLLNHYLAERGTGEARIRTRIEDVTSGRTVLSGDPVLQINAVHALLERIAYVQARGIQFWEHRLVLLELLDPLLTRQLPYTHDDLHHILKIAISINPLVPSQAPQRMPLGKIVTAVKRFSDKNGLSPDLRSCLEQLRAPVRRDDLYADDRKVVDRLDEMLGRISASPILAGEPWADVALQDLAAMQTASRGAWESLLAHAHSSDSARPTARWCNTARERVCEVGQETYKQHVGRWLDRLREQGDRPVNDRNGSVLKGLVWCCSFFEDIAVCRAVGNAAEACFRTIPDWGPTSIKVGNACLYALGSMPGTEPVARLARLKLRVKNRTAQAGIQKALEAAALRAGMSSDELEELSVPTYGLDSSGCLRQTLGDFRVEIDFAGTHPAGWRWIGPDGQTPKSVPAVVRTEHADELKHLKQTVDEVQKMLPAQRSRLERLLRSHRFWELAAWRERYADHTLLADLSHRLLWHFRRGDRSVIAGWNGDRWVDEQDQPLDWLTDDTEVRLWHPIGFDPELVLRWRRWLDEHQVAQPFKQAHREIYILTDAELQTRTYSNRFAAHILKQHQLNALCQQKAWVYHLQGGFDSGYEPMATLALPAWGMQAQFWVDPVEGDDALTDAGIFLYVSTDQVRFCDPDGEPVPLVDVPALLFSEVMRDVDLFVGVASIANDPAWQDRGDANWYRDYWHSTSFGELSASATTRREVLQRLLPRLKIAPRCSLEGKFLIVRGDLRTYKIHLGSSNILMAPNDEYLCIVPARGGAAVGEAGRVFLPFEGDTTLSLILSKAFLLAEDTKIRDSTILGQIRRAQSGRA